MTDTKIPLPSALKRKMDEQIRVQRAQRGAFERLLRDRIKKASTPTPVIRGENLRKLEYSNSAHGIVKRNNNLKDTPLYIQISCTHTN
jgi:hypothetical protein